MTKRLFTEIAGVYDRMNHLLSLGRDLRWHQAAVARVTVQPTRILGLDLTPAMLERARQKCASPQLAAVQGVPLFALTATPTWRSMRGFRASTQKA